MMKKCNTGFGIAAWVSFALVVIGGINWGLIGLFNYNFVESLLGAWPVIVRIIYLLVGLGALWMLYVASKCCKQCCSCGSCGTTNTTTTPPTVPPTNTNFTPRP